MVQNTGRKTGLRSNLVKKYATHKGNMDTKISKKNFLKMSQKGNK